MEVDARAILYMVANEFGLKRDSFRERVKIQKVIYLLQASGIQLGYGFGWYKYGPYSQDLVNDAYTVLGSRKSEYERAAREGSWDFSRETKDEFDKFRDCLGKTLDSLEELELLASVRFVKNMWLSDVKKEDFAEDFKKRKKKLCGGSEVTDPKINAAFDMCNKHFNN